jgi:hypothetical protein
MDKLEPEDSTMNGIANAYEPVTVYKERMRVVFLAQWA